MRDFPVDVQDVLVTVVEFMKPAHQTDGIAMKATAPAGARNEGE